MIISDEEYIPLQANKATGIDAIIPQEWKIHLVKPVYQSVDQ